MKKKITVTVVYPQTFSFEYNDEFMGENELRRLILKRADDFMKAGFPRPLIESCNDENVILG